MNDDEALRAYLFTDHFESHWCVNCGGTAALYVVPPGDFLGACSQCLVGRIEKWSSESQDVPDWVRNLESEARREIAFQARKQSNEFGADLGNFYRCHVCGKLIQEADARYPIPFEGYAGEVFPHCTDCYATL